MILNNIEAYLDQVKVEMIKLKVDLSFLEDFRTNILEEWSDFRLEDSSTPESELELEFITKLDSPTEIAKSLAGKDKIVKIRDDFWVIRNYNRLIAAYNTKIMSNSLGALMTYFVVWTTPAIIYFISNIGYDVIRLIPYSIPFREILQISFKIFDSVTELFLFNEVSFYFYTVFDLNINFWVSYRYPLTIVLCFLLFTGFMYRSIDSLRRLCLIIVVSAFSSISSLFITSLLVGNYHYPFEHGSITASLIWGYSVLFGSLIGISLLILILMVFYDIMRGKPIYNDYSILVRLIKNQESPYLTALIATILSFSPKIILIFSSPNFMHIYELAVILFLLVCTPVYIIRKTNLKFGIKVFLFQIVILILFWFSVPINFGMIISTMFIGTIIYELNVNKLGD